MAPVLDLHRPAVGAPTMKPAPRDTAPAGLSIADAIALALLFTAVLVAIMAGIRYAAGPGGRRQGLLPLLIAQLIAGPIVLALGVRWSRLPARTALSLRAFPLRVLPAVVLGSLGVAISAVQLTRLLPGASAFREGVVEEFRASATLVPVLTGIVMAPVLEELLLRGVLLRGLLVRHSAWTAAIVTALLFALFHLTATQAVVALPLGLGFAWVALRTGSVIPTMVAHAAVNASSVLTVLALLARYTPEQIAAMNRTPATFLMGAAAAAIIGVVATWWQLRDYRPAAGDVPAAAAPQPLPYWPRVLRPALAICLGVLLLAGAPRTSRTLWLRGLETPESGPPSARVMAAAGCYTLDAPPAIAGELFPGAAPGPLPLRLTTTRYRLGVEHPSRYLVQLLPHAGAAPLARGARTPGAPTYWLAPDGSLAASLVGGRAVIRLRARGSDLSGEAMLYDPTSGVPASPAPVTARRIPCPGDPAGN